MIDVAASISVFILSGWFILSLIFSVAYRFIAPLSDKTAPNKGIILFLAWWSAPVVITILLSLLLYLPGIREVLVSSHCHYNCDTGTSQNHYPVLNNTFIENLSLTLLICLLLTVALNISKSVGESLKMRRLLNQVSKHTNEYQLLETGEAMIFTIGWLKPLTCISRGLLENASQQDIDIALSHEKIHGQRRHNLILLAGHLLTLALPPAMRKTTRKQLRLLTERACDLGAAQQFGRIAVAEAIINIHKLAGAHAGESLHSRINGLVTNQSMLTYNKNHIYSIALILLIGLLLAVEPLHYFSEWLFTH